MRGVGSEIVTPAVDGFPETAYSLPRVVGRGGILDTPHLHLTDAESADLLRSAELLAELLADIDLPSRRADIGGCVDTTAGSG